MNKRTAKIARTAAGLTHINRLYMPSFGVAECRLKTPNDAHKSASHTPKGQSAGSSDVFNFAPGRANDDTPIDPVQIVYRLDNPVGAIQRAKLELFTRFDKNPVWTLDLTEEQFAHGEHRLDWDGGLRSEIAPMADKGSGVFTHQFKGAVKPTERFLDGYLTAAYSPYRLKITLGGDQSGDPPTGWTDFHILIHSIELELGWKDTLTEKRDQWVWEDLCGKQDTLEARRAALPKEDDAEPKKIFLLSNLFTTDHEEAAKNVAFEEYQRLWGDGPRIPLFARAWIKNAQGAQEVKDGSAVALGGVKFLWDCAGLIEDTTRLKREEPRTYIGRAHDYFSLESRPMSDLCHQERGGKRAKRPSESQANAHPLFFPKQEGEDPKIGHKAGKFPFKVTPARREHRFWAATSEAWTTGILQGRTGVMFRPSRMAGDAYRVTCYLAFDRDEKGEPLLDFDGMINAPIKAATGMMQIWRKVTISQYVRKTRRIPDFFASKEWAAVQAVYREAYIQLEPVPDMNKSFFTRELYHNLISEALKSHFNATDVDENGEKVEYEETDECEDPTPEQSDFFRFLVGKSHHYDGSGSASNPSHHAITFHNWEQMQQEVYQWFYARRRKCHPKEPDSASRTLGVVYGNKWINTIWDKGVLGYVQYLMDLASSITNSAFNKLDMLTAAPHGITVIEFDHIMNIENPMHEVRGIAIDHKRSTRQQCAYLAFGSDTRVMAHEIGHHLFLPHAPGDPPSEGQSSGYGDGHDPKPDMHDKDDHHCLMSYNTNIETFCGKCLLRLRGWDANALDKDGTKNAKS